VLELDALPDYHDVVQRQFEVISPSTNITPTRFRFLRAVQSVFLEKRKLAMADLYEPPLTNFGADAVERWFTEKEVEDVVEFANRMAV